MAKNDSNLVGEFVGVLPEVKNYHSPYHGLYGILRRCLENDVCKIFESKKTARIDMGPIGWIKFPFVSMGATSSVNLFDLDEVILFSFYWRNRGNYKKVADVGANIGLHTVILGMCGYRVRAYEPDPGHIKVISRSLKLNKLVNKAQVIGGAVSVISGSAEFVRVLGNTTGSHLAGAKANPYGKLERFDVKLYPIRAIMRWADLVKMDIEGHELVVLNSTEKEDWQATDMIVEIGSEENAQGVFEHMKKIGVNMFAQKNGWECVMRVSDMPISYKDGSLFITLKKEVPWGEDKHE